MFLKACINGARAPRSHPALDPEPRALARQARESVAAGAQAIHVHPKTATGRDTLAAPEVAATLSAIREMLPDTLVGITTGAWAVPDGTDRRRPVDEWTELPDFASVNWHEAGAVDLAEHLLDRGVAVEAGLHTLSAATAWLAWPRRAETLRALIEIGDRPEGGDARDRADVLLARLGETPVPKLLHGEGQCCWSVFELAVARGLGSRIGLEDTLVLPDGSPAIDNATLVQAAVHLAG